VSHASPPVRVAPHQWLGYDPGDQLIAIAYSERDALWQVRLGDEIEEHLDDDLRGALAETTEADPDEPWIVDLAGSIEHDLNHLEGGRDGDR
jgi:hypothetical protein